MHFNNDELDTLLELVDRRKDLLADHVGSVLNAHRFEGVDLARAIELTEQRNVLKSLSRQLWSERSRRRGEGEKAWGWRPPAVVIDGVKVQTKEAA
jgi:hypothetical protein